MARIFNNVALIAGVALSLSMASSVVAKEPALFPISVKGKWGYIDANGTVVIEPQFLKAKRFSEGLAVVKVAGTSEDDRLWKRTYEGFIGTDGKFVIPPVPPPEAEKFENYNCYSYGDFHEGLARVHVNDASGADGFIDRTGKLVIPFKFDSGSEFSEGVVFAVTWKKWNSRAKTKSGFIDKTGKFVIEINDIYHGYAFSEGRSVVERNTPRDECALIDNSGKFVIPFGVYDSLSSPVRGAIRAVKDRKVGLLNVDGEVIVRLGEFDQILESETGEWFTAERGGKTLFIDSTGKVQATVAVPGDVSRLSGGMAWIKQEGRFGYVDATGALRITPQFDSPANFKDGMSLVTTKQTRGYINTKGEWVWKTDRWDR